MLKEIDIALQNNNWDRAIELINLQDDVFSNKELIQRLGWAYSRKENYDKSINCFDKLIEMEPGVAKWPYMRGYQFYMQSKWESAIENFLVSLKLYPNYLVVKYRLAYAYLQIAGDYMKYTKDIFWKALGQLQECHKIYEKLSEDLQKKEINTYFDICFLHGKTIQEMNGKQDEAIALLNKALSIKNDIDCQYQLAKTYYLIKDYSRALEILPNGNKYYILELKATILSEMGNLKESNDVLNKLIKFRKKDYIYCKLAENYNKENRIKEAINLVLKAAQLGKDNYKNYLLLGSLYYKNKQYKLSIEKLQLASELKLKKFNLSCPEANKLIEEILEITNNNPYDEIMNKKESTIISFNSDKGFGFIQDEEYGKIFVHITNIINAKNKNLIGKRVSYDIEKNDKGFNAVSVYIKED